MTKSRDPKGYYEILGVPSGAPAFVRGIDTNKVIGALAQQSGQEGMAERISAAHGEFLASGQAALTNVGVRDHADFEAFVREHHAEAAVDAVRDLVAHRSVARLQALGRKYVQQANAKLARIVESHGVNTRTDADGTVWVSARDLGLPTQGDFGQYITLSKAIRDGHIEIA